MARSSIRCTGCNHPLTPHCPNTNATCTWWSCLEAGCTVRYLDVGRGLIQHTDGTVIGWDQMPTTTEPPTITIEDHTDGTTAPDT